MPMCDWSSDVCSSDLTPNTTERLSLFTFMHWRRKWQPTPVFLPGESQGQGSLVGCRPWGCTESDTTEATSHSLHAVCGCVLTTEAEMSGGNTDTGPTGRAPSGVYGTLTNSCSGTLKVKVKVAQSCPTLCNPMDYTVLGILQARILEWVAISFSRGGFTRVRLFAIPWTIQSLEFSRPEYWSG